jgi:hypothetical protein
VGKSRPGRDANQSPRLVPRSRIVRSYISLPLVTCMTEAVQLYFKAGGTYSYLCFKMVESKYPENI